MQRIFFFGQAMVAVAVMNATMGVELARAAKVAPVKRTAFRSACEKRLEGQSKSPQSVCSCIATAIEKKLKHSELEQIIKVYQGEDPQKLKVSDVVLDFEMAASEKCMKP